MKEYDLTMPLYEAGIRKLRMGDIVYYSGVVHTMRDMGHRRAVEMLIRNEELPFKQLREGVLWHCGPIVSFDSGKWKIFSAGPTTSSRFTDLGSELIKLCKIRLTIGKGTMGDKAVSQMKETGSCYLNSTGGCGALYAQKIKGVLEVYWQDLGLPEAIWTLEVERLGPLVVGIDTLGNSIFDAKKLEMKKEIQKVYKQSRLNFDYDYFYLPKRIPGRG
jgi:fumarate hydratase subunit beta